MARINIMLHVFAHFVFVLYGEYECVLCGEYECRRGAMAEKAIVASHCVYTFMFPVVRSIVLNLCFSTLELLCKCLPCGKKNSWGLNVNMLLVCYRNNLLPLNGFRQSNSACVEEREKQERDVGVDSVGDLSWSRNQSYFDHWLLTTGMDSLFDRCQNQIPLVHDTFQGRWRIYTWTTHCSLILVPILLSPIISGS